MEIQQFRYASDNLGYLLYRNGEAMAIDGGAVDGILSFVKENGLDLKWVTNTHAHPDHTVGTETLSQRSGAALLNHRKITASEPILLGGEMIKTLPTPGHTDDSVTFSTGSALICGDTLFNGTVGNCFSGDLKGFFLSIKTLCRFPPETVVYAGHDYVRESMVFARSVEPENGEIDRYLSRYRPGHVWSTLADEMKVNPYLRFNEPSIVKVCEERGWEVGTEYDRWKSVMRLE